MVAHQHVRENVGEGTQCQGQQTWHQQQPEIEFPLASHCVGS